VLVTGVASLASGKDAESSLPSAGGSALFDRLDANQDSAITADEVATENRPLFDRLIRKGDSNHDGKLSRDEFAAALKVTRPAKPLEEQEPSTVPQADAVRYMLLTLDKNRNARIEKDELPRDRGGVMDMLMERVDRNGNGALERQELSRGGPAMSAIAGRYVERMKIDVDAELAKLKKSEGEDFDRFEQQPVPLEQLRDAKQARQLFAQFDENADGKLDPKELPAPQVERFDRLVRIADRDGDGKLTQDEFVAATERIGKFLNRGGPEAMPLRERLKERKAAKDESTSARK